ncbi:MAG: hypothetical protein LBV08_04820 [Clostridiales bacterium]|nr:hypothetical protein [Clostridiales bacterium]
MKKKERNLVLLSYFILYIVHFVIIPMIVQVPRQWYMLLVTTVIMTLFCAKVISDKIEYWFLGILLYVILIIMYYPNKGYGMNVASLTSIPTDYKFISIFTESFSVFDVWGFAVIIIFVFGCQLIIWTIIKILKYLIKKIKTTDNEK